MKKLALQTLGFILLTSSPVLIEGADSLHPQSVPVVSTSEASKPDSAIDATYATKHLLSSIMEKFPDLTVQEALSRSALLGIISETDVKFHMYGTYQEQPDPKRPDRTIKVFNTTTPLNGITRSMFDVLDGRLRATVQPSNPFCALEGKNLAHIMQQLTIGPDGIVNLINLLENQAFISNWSDDWDATVNPPTKNPDPKKPYSLSEFKKKVKDFVKLLETVHKEAKTPADKAKIVNDLAKIFMTFLALKDQNQKVTGKSYAIEEYYTTLLGKPFESDYYTSSDLERMEGTLLNTTPFSFLRDPKKLEKSVAYLNHFAAGNTSFLQTPFARYTSHDKTYSYSYCVEAAIRSIMNSILYNPETGKLDIHMLPLALQNHMNPKFKAFIEKYPDPTVPNYYGNSLVEWLDLVTGLEGVVYKNGEGSTAYEISAAAGPSNLVAVLNNIFGTKADSFEGLGAVLEKNASDGTPLREVSFTPQAGDFELKVSDHGTPVIKAIIESEEGRSHAVFALKKGTNLLDLLDNNHFRSSMATLSEYSHQDLYGIIFNPTTLNVAGDRDWGILPPLIEGIRSYGSAIVKSMLTYGADPNFKGTSSHTPLEVAADSLQDISIIEELLTYKAVVTPRALTIASAEGYIEAVKTFIPLLEHNQTPIDYNYLIIQNLTSRHSSLPLIQFLMDKRGGDIHFKENSFVCKAARYGLLPIVQYFVEQGAPIKGEFPTENNPLEAALQAVFFDNPKNVPQALKLVQYLIDHGATLPPTTPDENFLGGFIHSPKAVTVMHLLKKAQLFSAEIEAQLIKLSLKRGVIEVAQPLIEESTDLRRVEVEWITNGKLTLSEKLYLIKIAVEKNISISLSALKEIEDNEKKAKTVDEKHQWTDLLVLLKNTMAEQSFGLPLTTEEQRCITECVTEKA
jgi:ankyrin repeat protein